MGALVENTLQAICPGAVLDFHAVIPLPCETVKGKRRIQHFIQFPDGLGFQLLSSHKTAHIGCHLDLALFQIVIKRLARKCAMCRDRHNRNTQLFQQNAHLPGQCGGCAVKRIAGFGIHQNAGLFFFQHVLHIPDQAHIADKFLGGNATQKPHQPLHAHKTVGSTDNAVLPGIKNPGHDHQIHKAGVVHEDQAGLTLDLFHIMLGKCKARGPQIRQ